MKEKAFGICIITIVTLFVIVNTYILNKQLLDTANSIQMIKIEESNTNEAKKEAEAIFSIYEKREKYISLTVSHEDLTNIENAFVDMIGYLSVADTDNALVAKSRLIYSLEHLRRLSSISFEAII